MPVSVKHIDENNVVVDGKRFKAVDALNIDDDTCPGCEFDDNDCVCSQMPFCGRYMRNDERNVIWVVQV